MHFPKLLQTILEHIFVKTQTKTIFRMSSVYKHKAPVRGKVWRRKLSLSLGRVQLCLAQPPPKWGHDQTDLCCLGDVCVRRSAKFPVRQSLAVFHEPV